VLGRIGGVEKVQIIKDSSAKASKREKFLEEFEHAVGQAKDFKDGKIEFSTWEEMMHEI